MDEQVSNCSILSKIKSNILDFERSGTRVYASDRNLGEHAGCTYNFQNSNRKPMLNTCAINFNNPAEDILLVQLIGN
jgi:hypothetical protein